MVTKPRATARLGYSVTLLIIFALLGYVAATEDLTAVVINSKNSERNIRITDGNAEDRAIDAKISGVAKLVEALKSKSPFVDGLLSKIKAHTPVSNLLESQQFNTLSSHISDTYPGKADEVMIAILATKYDDEALTAILHAARTRDQTKDLADRLSKARLSNWFHEEVTADDAFLKLKLPASGDMMVWFSETRLWLSYVSKLHPQNVDDEILCAQDALQIRRAARPRATIRITNQRASIGYASRNLSRTYLSFCSKDTKTWCSKPAIWATGLRTCTWWTRKLRLRP
ncbi:hypothetical protein PHYSODRAFT_288729 [Phytophthora sojae]|uniref:RxLR effector protein n=2 Tax=Phytophthora sojae TaxID=67593 RepID=G5A571_PHYSP|nr:hypothetical protein PHYSODRAFT_288729 [Phytophthora sojae]AEK81126.1 Avh295a1 [Phytophthora sojae]AEK81127.1 Avh295a1 [Phytophthora sojae]EGZ09256.1 hypothetical protein PHYSODRAFT_288729 [Phytophthora sojae]|eukprot:XP_009535889.1 hypothetical protein PHYSODRAFT_288729 [Phytophthora sojae]